MAHINLSKEKTVKVKVCRTSCETVKYSKSLLGEKELAYFATEETQLLYTVHLKSCFSCKQRYCKTLLWIYIDTSQRRCKLSSIQIHFSSRATPKQFLLTESISVYGLSVSVSTEEYWGSSRRMV